MAQLDKFLSAMTANHASALVLNDGDVMTEVCAALDPLIVTLAVISP